MYYMKVVNIDTYIGNYVRYNFTPPAYPTAVEREEYLSIFAVDCTGRLVILFQFK